MAQNVMIGREFATGQRRMVAVDDQGQLLIGGITLQPNANAAPIATAPVTKTVVPIADKTTDLAADNLLGMGTGFFSSHNFTPTAPGTGYTTGDEGFVTGGSGDGARYHVISIAADGAIARVSLFGGGGYQTNETLTFAGKGNGDATYTLPADVFEVGVRNHTVQDPIDIRTSTRVLITGRVVTNQPTALTNVHLPELFLVGYSKGYSYNTNVVNQPTDADRLGFSTISAQAQTSEDVTLTGGVAAEAPARVCYYNQIIDPVGWEYVMVYVKSDHSLAGGATITSVDLKLIHF